MIFFMHKNILNYVENYIYIFIINIEYRIVFQVIILYIFERLIYIQYHENLTYELNTISI